MVKTKVLYGMPLQHRPTPDFPDVSLAALSEAGVSPDDKPAVAALRTQLLKRKASRLLQNPCTWLCCVCCLLVIEARLTSTTTVCTSVVV